MTHDRPYPKPGHLKGDALKERKRPLQMSIITIMRSGHMRKLKMMTE
jgi:hypothetical protein